MRKFLVLLSLCAIVASSGAIYAAPMTSTASFNVKIRLISGVAASTSKIVNLLPPSIVGSTTLVGLPILTGSTTLIGLPLTKGITTKGASNVPSYTPPLMLSTATGTSSPASPGLSRTNAVTKGVSNTYTPPSMIMVTSQSDGDIEYMVSY